MDPNSTVKRITELFRDGEFNDAIDSAYDLLIWLDRGGFPPQGFTADAARILCRTAIAAGECTCRHTGTI